MTKSSFLFFLFTFLAFSSAQLTTCSYRPFYYTSLNLTNSSSQLLSQDCLSSANNISLRISFPEFVDCLPRDTSGPQPNNYPLVPLPTDCDSTLWIQARVLQAIDYVVSLNVNYCHHHTPGWVAIDSPIFRTTIDGTAGVCYDRGANGTNQWRGIDCSTFTSFVYNFGLGTPFTKDIKSQACSASAPGRVLDINNATILTKQDTLQPGDLLYIAGKGNISHAVSWTGYKLTNGTGRFGLDTIINSYDQATRNTTYSSALYRLKKNQTIYLIADSSGNGPNYRMFLWWYVDNFSHARRIINPDPSLPTYCP